MIYPNINNVIYSQFQGYNVAKYYFTGINVNNKEIIATEIVVPKRGNWTEVNPIPKEYPNIKSPIPNTINFSIIIK